VARSGCGSGYGSGMEESENPLRASSEDARRVAVLKGSLRSCVDKLAATWKPSLFARCFPSIEASNPDFLEAVRKRAIEAFRADASAQVALEVAALTPDLERLALELSEAGDGAAWRHSGDPRADQRAHDMPEGVPEVVPGPVAPSSEEQRRPRGCRGVSPQRRGAALRAGQGGGGCGGGEEAHRGRYADPEGAASPPARRPQGGGGARGGVQRRAGGGRARPGPRRLTGRLCCLLSCAASQCCRAVRSVFICTC